MTIMMKLYAYCIIDSNCEITEPIRGLEGSSIFNIPYLDIGSVVSELKTEIQLIAQEDVLKHEEVMEKLMERFGVFPFRFPTAFDKKETLMSMLRGHYDDFKNDIAGLRNKVEFGIKVIWPADTIKNRITQAFANGVNGSPSSDDSKAKAFIRKRFEGYKIQKEFEEEAQRCIDLVDGFFNKFAAQKRLDKLRSEALLLDARYLIDKEKEGLFKEAFDRIKNTKDDLKYLISGPWPPYSFCNVIASPRREASGAKQSQM